MATIVLAAAGAAFGAGFGGTVLGLSGAVIGRAIGATVGRVIDQRVMGLGSDPVETGRLDRLLVMGASEGARIPVTWGRMRLPGQVIWASNFTEIRQSGGGGRGKGGGGRPTTVSYSYSVSLAIALCEGEIQGVGRIWADGKELAQSSLEMRVYPGSDSQDSDPAISAAMGPENTPNYRGTAYVVLENLLLEPFGNRVPQFSFEVLRKAEVGDSANFETFQDAIQAVALIPGTGEYALATEKVSSVAGLFGTQEVFNVNSISEEPDFTQSLKQLSRELPGCTAVSLIVSWFGDDLRCGECKVLPKVARDFGVGGTFTQPWRAGGYDQSTVQQLAQAEGKAIYGGTPSDASVIQAIQALKQSGKEVMFYPFILMEQQAGNALANPYTGETGQPAFPWRGRITLNRSPGSSESSDGTLFARSEVRAFFGDAQPNDFAVNGTDIIYSGPTHGGYRRFILHYAHLCALAGGVESFCIGSEMRGLTTIMGEGHSFPAVEELITLAEDVRAILGPGVKLSYAADWSEYFGFHRGEDVYFHLDPLWGHPEIDFVGVDNYMPISDWRDGALHADNRWPSIYDIDYLSSNICGGEGFDWFYDSVESRLAQVRKPIEDGMHGEDWVYRYKDFRSWWGNYHHNRVNGLRDTLATSWDPGSKPIRFTEYGCAALDKGTNEPNRFLDPKSSESGIPFASNGNRDDFIQLQYYRAMRRYWNEPENNPSSVIYDGRMIDMAHAYAWAWDCRPYPDFPRNLSLWADGENWRKGHWLNGRAMSQPLDAVVREISQTAGLANLETQKLYGMVAGFAIQDIGSARSALQPLTTTFGFDPVEAEGQLSFISRGVNKAVEISREEVTYVDGKGESLKKVRLPDAEIVRQVRLGFVSDAGDFRVRQAEDRDAHSAQDHVSFTEYPGLLPDEVARAVTKRWLVEGQVARDLLMVELAPSRTDIGAGDIISMDGLTYRVDRMEIGETRQVEATRIANAIYELCELAADVPDWRAFRPPSAVVPFWLDIPSSSASERPFGPHVGVSAQPWPGQVAVWQGIDDASYSVVDTVEGGATVGLTETVLRRSRLGLLDDASLLRVKLNSGTLSSTTLGALLSGSNAAAIGDGSKDNWEIIQFQTAELIDANTFALSGLLRGQLGTDGAMPSEWPIGSVFVLLDSAVQHVPLAASLRNVDVDLRVGLASKGAADIEARRQSLAFAGNHLRPYSVCHFKMLKELGGDLVFSWIRRTRIGGDDWSGLDVPLSEEREIFQLRILNAVGQIVREETTFEPSFRYTTAQQLADGWGPQFAIEIAQISMTYGPGTWRRFFVDL